jgi:predicted alpha/beta-hydrolase family hydrolase
MQNIKKIALITILFLCTFSIFGQSAFAANAHYIELPSRDNITQPFLLLDTPNAVASVILFAGASGFLELDPDGTINQLSGNFLVRSRELFAAQGLQVVVYEVPSHKNNDFGLLGGYRRTNAHAQDIEVVIDYLKKKDGLPVWLIGTSRGSPSASNAAARLPGKVDGVVLTSSLSETNNKGTQVFETGLNKITAPVYVASHKDDICHVTPPEHVKYIAKKLTKSPNVKTMLFTGGDQPQGKDCGAMSAHGFIGIEALVVKNISDFIKENLLQK